jgi:dihydroflavonol-4-reductase
VKIAVTGATGHLGTVLVRDPLKEGHELKVLARSNTHSIHELPVTITKGDITDKVAVRELLKDADTVIHCAAMISISGDPQGIVRETNVTGTETLLNAALECGVKKYIQISSIHAYQQRPVAERLDETRSYVGENGAAYDRSKRDAQQLVLAYADKGLDVTVVNPTSIVGPPDYRPSLMGQAIVDLCTGKVPGLIPGGFDFTDVRDVSAAIVNAISHGRNGECYLLSGKWYSISSVADILSDISGKNIRLLKMPVWSARIGVPFIKAYAKLTGTRPLYTHESIDALTGGNRYIDAAKAKAELHYDVRPFRDTLRDTYYWFLENGFIKNNRRWF